MQDFLSSWARTGRILLRNVLDRKHEPETAHLARFLRPGDRVLHVGASDGRHTVVMSRLVGETGHVYCFEPSDFTLEILRRALRFHRITNVSTFNVAVGDVPGKTLLITPVKANGHLGRSFAFVADSVPALEPLRASRGFQELRSHDVAVWTLDGFCEERGIDRVGLIRCDVEGAEGLVLAGARGILERDRPPLLLEVHPHALRDQFGTSATVLREHLEVLGYGFWYVRDGELCRTAEFFDEPWRDYFCVPFDRARTLNLPAAA